MSATPDPASDPILDVRALRAGYDGTTIVQGVDLLIERGEVLTMLGLNGAGKSTLLKAIAGLLPFKGEVLLDGTDVSKWTGARINRAGLAYVPQGMGVFPGVSVGDHLRMARHFRPEREAMQAEFLDWFPVRGLTSDNFAELSAGGKVLDYLWRLGDEGCLVASVRGNHEQMLLDACRNRDAFRLWLLNGGGATLASFGVEDACDIPVLYRRYLAELPSYLLLERFVLVHGCLDFKAADPFADTEAMLWGRSCTVDMEKTSGRRLVTGHTPASRAMIEASLKDNRILLDHGGVYRGHPGLGALAALELTSLRIYFCENCESG